MGAPFGSSADDLGALLREHPYLFSFFQAVRVLEQNAILNGLPASSPVGGDDSPSTEIAHFKALPSLQFPACEVTKITGGEKGQAPLDMTVSFMGLTGPAGVLPQHYTALLLERIHHRHRDTALQEFFDLFNHRSISFFYRAWEKYRFPFSYERATREDTEDLFTQCLQSLVGLGQTGLNNRSQNFNDLVPLFYSGYFSEQNRSAVALERMVADYFQVEAKVVQFCGRWLDLDEHDQSCLRPESPHENLTLGVDALVGSRIWDLTSRFRIRIGPLTLDEFQKWLPDGSTMNQLNELVRLYVGIEFDFEVQLVLQQDEVPECCLSNTEGSADSAEPPPLLGWMTWITSGPVTADADDAIFAEESVAT